MAMQIRDLLTEKRLAHLEEMVSEIPPDTLRSKFENEEIFKLIEVSEKAEFDNGHIENAINVPLDELVDFVNTRFKKFQQIILYAHDGSTSIATIGARRLQHAGYSNVQVLKGGKEGWRSAHLPLVGNKNDGAVPGNG